MCDSVEGPGVRWTRSAVLHALTISTTTPAVVGNLTLRARIMMAMPAAQPILENIAKPNRNQMRPVGFPHVFA